jgi:hypothetical protein
MSAKNASQLDEIITERIIELMSNKQMIQWCLKLLQKYKNEDKSIHIFCLDFSSALLANILHASTSLEMLESNVDLT